MTIDEILQKVDSERRIEGRFPVRMIFCESLYIYKQLVARLRGECDCCQNIAEFCSEESPDRYPKFKKLEQFIEENKDKHILLLSVGEYLRMVSKQETAKNMTTRFCELWTRMETTDSKTRVFIPLFSAKGYFDKAVGQVDERQKDFLWEADGEDGRSYKITVYSDKFQKAFLNKNAVRSVKEWLLNWENCLKTGNSIIVTTKIEGWEKTFGKVSVDVIKSPYDFLASIEPAVKTLKPQIISDEYWADLAMRILTGCNVKDAILEAVNLKKMDNKAVLARWETMTSLEQWYVWLWFQIEPNKGYLATILNKLKIEELKTLPDHILNDIIYYMNMYPQWIEERQTYVEAIPNEKNLSKDFFAALSKADLELVFRIVPGKTLEEQAFLIKMLCQYLRKEGKSENIPCELMDRLEQNYPELSAYLRTPDNYYGEYTNYFDWYKRKKIINRPETRHFPSPDVDLLDTRSYLLSQYNGRNCISYWIDGLGIEWMSLIGNVLDACKHIDFSYKFYRTKCVIPSETAFNKQWDLNEFPYKKRNRLDLISHKGMPDDKDFFLAMANQIFAVKELIKEAVELLQDYEYVIITGDHGSSRLAALGFHEEGTLVPRGAKSMDLGRFCQLDRKNDSELIPDNAVRCKVKNETYLVMKTYNHFIQPGNAAGGNSDENAIAGEVHGGMTPEECIVPVFVLKRNSEGKQLIYSVKDGMKLEISGDRAGKEISFNKPVETLVVETSMGKCDCIQEQESTWKLSFTGMEEGITNLTFIADGKLIASGIAMLVEKRGIKKGKMGGLP